jgi:NAD(P)H-hydrate repair Nnr-like enzyme with NAD(P)H-hydrate dehydratase domain
MKWNHMAPRTYWHKQGKTPLYPDLIWSRPENKQAAGKLLIIGGHAYGFAAPAVAYQEAVAAGIGSARVLIPDHIKKQLEHFQGPALEITYAPSTPSGSFASRALAEMHDSASWSDAILLAGDLGKNSETAIVIEKLLRATHHAVTITQDAIEYVIAHPDTLLKRQHTALVLTMSQLQKLFKNNKSPIAITHSMDLMQLIDVLHEFTKKHPVAIIVRHHDTMLVAYSGDVSTTEYPYYVEDAWQVPVAAHVAVWWLQNPSKAFQAMTSALIQSDS